MDVAHDTQIDHFPPEVESPPTNVTRVFAANVVLLIVFGVALFWWLGHYTDSFAEAAAVLTLSGALTWLAFMLKVLPDEAKKSAQTGFYRHVLENRVFTVFILLVGAVLLVLSFKAGPMEVTLAEGASDRAVRFGAAISAGGDPEWVAKGKPTRFVFSKPLCGPGQIKVKVSGYPSKVVTLKAWKLPKVRAPQHFVRRVLVLRPTRGFGDNHAAEPRPATITIKTATSTDSYETALGANAVWVGCDDDVEVPDNVRDEWSYAWRTNYDAAKHAFDENARLNPSAPAGTPPELREDRLKLYWLKPKALRPTNKGTDGSVVTAPDLLPNDAEVTITLAPVSGKKVATLAVPGWSEGQGFPQVFDIKEP